MKTSRATKKLQYANCEFRTCDGQLHLSREFCPAARLTGLTAECAAQVTFLQTSFKAASRCFLALCIFDCCCHACFTPSSLNRTAPAHPTRVIVLSRLENDLSGGRCVADDLTPQYLLARRAPPHIRSHTMSVLFPCWLFPGSKNAGVPRWRGGAPRDISILVRSIISPVGTRFDGVDGVIVTPHHTLRYAH